MMDLTRFSPFPISYLAMVLPPLEPEAYQALLTSIREEGLRHPVIVWRGEIIDGVHRLKACFELGMDPTFVHLPDDANPLQFLRTESFPSRDMDENDRARAAHKLSQWSPRGRPPAARENSEKFPIITQEEAANQFRVSVKSVSTVGRVLSEDGPAVPALREAADQRRIKFSDAARVLDKPAEVQERAVALVLEGQTRTVKRAAERVEREVVEAAEAEALAEILAQPLDETVTLHVAQVADMLRLVPEGSVDAIITNPPQGADQLFIHSDLAALAAQVLKPTGFLAVVGNGMLLSQVLQHLGQEGLRWIMEADLYNSGLPDPVGRPHFLNLHRRPVLIYGMPRFQPGRVSDFIQVPLPGDLPPGLNQHDMAIQLVLERFCRPGQVVCDPAMLDRASTALAARKLGCNFIGGAKDQACKDRIHARLATAEDHLDGPEDDVGTGGQ